MKRTWDALLSGMEIATKAIEAAGIFKPITDNLLNDDDIQTLTKKMKELQSIKADKVNELRTEELRTGKKAKNEFKVWCSNVATTKDRVEKYEEEVRQGGLGCKLSRKRSKKLIEEVKELIDESTRLGQLVSDVGVSSKLALLAPKLEGEEFRKNIEKIREYLDENEGFNIGVCGMAGVGKTTLIKHIYNELLRQKRNVYWIAVSQESFSISKLQKRIAKAIGRDISSEDDEKKRAALLYSALIAKPKFVLILDDLWEHFSLDEVGIPISSKNGCKLILTSRSLEVCNKMDCHKKVKVKPLSENEAWNLFKKTLGEELPAGFVESAKAIAKKCDGLPLGIITMASSMKGVNDLREWRDTLRQLKESNANDCNMDMKVFRILRFSYDRLDCAALQKCFLSCALYPEDYKIRRVHLIEYLIAEGVIKEKRREDEFNKGHTMLNKLERVCLLEGVRDDENYECVKMHDLMRVMAIQLTQSNTLICTDSAVLNCESWTEDLVTISSMYAEEIHIPSDYSVTCLMLSALLLRCALLRSIPDHIFVQLHKLGNLDLSKSLIEVLPNCITELCNLTTLSLRRCRSLKCLPSLANLKRLKKLDLNYTKVEEIPQGLELLYDLKYLGLHGTRLKMFPVGILPNLPCLQVLLIDPRATVKADEVASLRKLETLCCRFCDWKEFYTHLLYSKENHGLSLRINGCRSHQVTEFCVLVGSLYDYREFEESDKIYNVAEEVELVLGNRVILGKYRINRGRFQVVEIESYLAGRILSLQNESITTELCIRNCVGIECMSSSELKSLKNFEISNLKDLRIVFCAATPPAPIPNGTFSLLGTFRIYGCPRIKKLFPLGMLANLQNLEELYVETCENMEEIFIVEEEEGEQRYDSSSYCLPKLSDFVLGELPELKSICSRKMICDSLKTFWVCYCPKLMRVPMSLLDVNQIVVRPREWWEKVELDHPKDELNEAAETFHFIQGGSSISICRRKSCTLCVAKGL